MKEAYAKIKERVERGIAAREFPGCVIGIVSRDGVRAVYQFGYLTYDANAVAVNEDTIYDLAAVTKSILELQSWDTHFKGKPSSPFQTPPTRLVRSTAGERATNFAAIPPILFLGKRKRPVWAKRKNYRPQRDHVYR